MTNGDFSIDPLQPTDANQLYQFMVDNTDRLSYYFPKTLAGNSTLEETRRYIGLKQKEIQDKTNYTFAIRQKGTGTIAGLVILKKIDWHKQQGELAYCIGAAFEKKGFTTFAVSQMKAFVFDRLSLNTIQIIAHKTNIGSIKVATNNGFTWQRTLPNEFTPTNELPLDMELYEVNR